MKRAEFGAWLVGLGLGGLLDSLLFHHLLKWHHLCSSIPAPMSTQLLWDSLFDLAMAGVVALGVATARPVAHGVPGQALAGAALMGFGSFQVLDGVLFHWALGLHHINMAAPLASDIIVAAIGLILVAAGAWLHRGIGHKGSGPDAQPDG